MGSQKKCMHLQVHQNKQVSAVFLYFIDLNKGSPLILVEYTSPEPPKWL